MTLVTASIAKNLVILVQSTITEYKKRKIKIQEENLVRNRVENIEEKKETPSGLERMEESKLPNAMPRRLRHDRVNNRHRKGLHDSKEATPNRVINLPLPGVIEEMDWPVYNYPSDESKEEADENLRE